ncbi:MAG: LPS-assembly protein LptD [Burkholderiales bacterium]|jgi:LPS-assembly protein|nr:LPS-assembly protein LptD [Burkholderiales bacterium]
MSMSVPRLAVVIALCASGATAAQDSGLGLKLDRQLAPPSPQADDDPDLPLFVEADEVTGVTGDRVDARGDVRLRVRGRTVFADDVHVAIPDEQVTATGHVRVDRRGDVLEADRAFIDLKNDTGDADSPAYYFRDFKARGRAQKLEILGRSRYKATRATYSTCEVPERDWFLRVGRLDLDRDAGKGKGRDVTVVFKSLPVLYTPYIDFPLSNERKSGLLAPTFGTTGRSGFEFTQPLYLNLAPNYDATIGARVLAKRGPMVTGEGRWLLPGGNGQITSEYLESDRERQGDTRYALAFRHTQRIGDRLTGIVNLQKASDDLYFVDFSNRLSVTSLTNLPREASLGWQGGWWSATGRVQSFQTLQDPRAPIVPPYARLPQLSLTAGRTNLGGFDLALQSEYVQFSHPTLVEGRRAIAYPSVAYPLARSYINVVPKLGLHSTQYLLDARSTLGDETRNVPVFSVDSTVTFERAMRFRGTALTQTLEPRLYYVYVPFVDQSRLPVFDTAVADFNLAQIFTENTFVGGDRIADANHLTGAVSSRFIDAADGQEKLRLTLAQRFYLSSQRVTLPNVVQVQQQNRSDLLMGLSGRMSQALYADLALQYDMNALRPLRTTAAFRWSPASGMVLNAGYRFFRDSFEQTDVSAQWPVSERWSAVGRFAYSLRERKPVTTIAGLEYNAGCWVARVVYQQFVTFTQDSIRAFFFQIELNGLTRIGNNPLDILRQNIGGYQKINSLPQSQTPEDYVPPR